MTTAHERAAEAGRAAHAARKGFSEVPAGYLPSKSLRKAWERGWEEAAKAALEAAREAPRITKPEARFDAREPGISTR